MHIDPFVLAAQIINFLVLVFLLKHLLYDKIIGAMDAREAKIASQFDEARRLREQALDAAHAYDEKSRELQDRALDMLNQAQNDADREKEVLMEKIRKEVEQVRQRWYETLNRQKQAFLEDLRLRAGTHIYDTIRQILAEMANEDLEERMVTVFTTRLKGMTSEQKLRLEDALKAHGAAITLRSAFVLNQQQRQKVEEAIRVHAGPRIAIRFETATAIGAGIEMMAHGYKLSWSIEDYLRSLEEQFVRIVREEIPLGEQTL